MTYHINAEQGDFAKVVLMPGDPLRAKWIAETFLTDPKLVNTVRGALGYTGTTKNGKRLSVMASGMGNPSIGIYSHELFESYGVEVIIRVGTIGGYQKDCPVKSLVFAMASSSDSNIIDSRDLHGHYSACCDYELLNRAVEGAKRIGATYHVGNVLSSDVFYDYNPDSWKKWAELGVLGVDMECYSLYVTAAAMKKKALGILSVSNSFVTGENLTHDERRASLREMIESAIYAAEFYC